MARGSYLAGIAAGVLGGMALLVHAASDITIGGNATLTTDYVFRDITQTAGNPAIQGKFDLLISSFILLSGAPIWILAVVRTGRKLPLSRLTGMLASGRRGASGPSISARSCNTACGIGRIDYWELKTGVSRNFFSDKAIMTFWILTMAGPSTRFGTSRRASAAWWAVNGASRAGATSTTLTGISA
jgi:uncharacterized protein Gcw-chp